MSISIILVPLAVAAVAALHSSRRDQDDNGRTVCHVGTRMRDENLLGDALSDTGAIVTRTSPNQIRAAWRGVDTDFTRDSDGIWSAHLVGEVDEERARSIVAGVDVAYGRRVQSAVLAKLRERAPAAGLYLQSENVEEDSSVTVVLTVQQGA
ncbi:MAG: hypothetical protein M3332_04260 [Actinomycetota bacterium]|nr:hypothetical protein [Actinomycetota bacterium]